MADKLSDEDIGAILSAGIQASVGRGDTKMSKERERVQRYRDGEYPKRRGDADSSFVSYDVYEGMESMKAQLLEVFSGGKQPVIFDPMPGEDPDSAQLRTDAVTDVIFGQNEGFGVFQTTIDDALSGRVGVVKVWWEDNVKFDYYDVRDTNFDALATLLAETPGMQVEDYELTAGDDGARPIKRVRLSVPKDRSKVRIQAIPPEEFGISTRATSIHDADLVFHRQRKSKSDLAKMGFEKSKIEDLGSKESIWLDLTPEVQSRFEPTDDIILSNLLNNGVGQKTCMLYECYAELDVDGSGKTELWKVMLVGDTVLDKERVSRKPFIAFVPLPRAHAFWGSNYGNQLVAIQNARTHLVRSIVNHALITNNPRIQVVKGALVNPKELLENRFGGLVNVTRPDGLVPMPQTGLNPFVFNTIEMLKASKEEITGISGLAQGLNKDAISKQNSGDMVHELISVSQIRQKIIARNFAENFLVPLYSLIYDILVENAQSVSQVYAGGKWQQVDFTAWPQETRMSVSFALGYGEQDREVIKWVNLDKYLSSDPRFAGQYTPEQRYKVVRRSLEAGGIRNVEDYLLPPSKAVQPPPDPMQMAELEVKKADAQVKTANAQAAVESIKLKQMELQRKAAFEAGKLDIAGRKETDTIGLKTAEFHHKVIVDSAELALEQKLANEAQESQAKAIISAAS